MILVAGGTGHLGRVLVARLVSTGSRVRVLTRNPSRARGLWTGDVELVAGDVSDAASLPPALAGVETVVSAVTGFGPGGSGPVTIDFHGNENLMATAEASGARRLILISIHRASPDHPMELNRMKFLAEERLRRSRLEWTIIRPTVFTELWVDLVAGTTLKRGVANVFGRGNNSVNFVSVEDVAKYVEMALSDPGFRRTAVDVGGPENLTLNRIIQLFEEVLDQKVAVRHIPLPLLRLGALMLRPMRPDLARLIRAAVAMDTADMSFDPGEMPARYPAIEFKRVSDVVRARCAIRASEPVPS